MIVVGVVWWCGVWLDDDAVKWFADGLAQGDQMLVFGDKAVGLVIVFAIAQFVFEVFDFLVDGFLFECEDGFFNVFVQAAFDRGYGDVFPH